MCGNMSGGMHEGDRCCGGHKMHSWWHTLVWVLLGLVVLGIVFCAGFKLGLVGSRFMSGGYYGPAMMYRGDGKVYMMGGWGGPAMMGNWQIREGVLQEQSTTSAQ